MLTVAFVSRVGLMCFLLLVIVSYRIGSCEHVYIAWIIIAHAKKGSCENVFLGLLNKLLYLTFDCFLSLLIAIERPNSNYRLFALIYGSAVHYFANKQHSIDRESPSEATRFVYVLVLEG